MQCQECYCNECNEWITNYCGNSLLSKWTKVIFAKNTCLLIPVWCNMTLKGFAKNAVFLYNSCAMSKTLLCRLASLKMDNTSFCHNSGSKSFPISNDCSSKCIEYTYQACYEVYCNCVDLLISKWTIQVFATHLFANSSIT